MTIMPLNRFFTRASMMLTAVFMPFLRRGSGAFAKYPHSRVFAAPCRCRRTYLKATRTTALSISLLPEYYNSPCSQAHKTASMSSQVYLLVPFTCQLTFKIMLPYTVVD